jgi:hypothetical protein
MLDFLTPPQQRHILQQHEPGDVSPIILPVGCKASPDVVRLLIARHPDSLGDKVRGKDGSSEFGGIVE